MMKLLCSRLLETRSGYRRNNMDCSIGLVLQRHWPIVVAVTILWTTIGLMLLVSMGRNDHHLIYALDDAYIHMAIAKHYALQGIWGITPFEFTSSTSSPLWTTLLAAIYAGVGPNEWTPLVLTTVSATLLLVVAYRILRGLTQSGPHILVILLSITLITPLPLLVLYGMEHLLHILLTLGFMHLSAQVLAGKPARAQWGRLLALTPVLTATRYEGMILVGVVVILLALRRNWAKSALLGIAAAFSPVLYGTFSVAHGWGFLPSTLMMKGLTYFEVMSWKVPARWLLNMVLKPELLALSIVAAFLFWRRRRDSLWEYRRLLLLVFLATAFLNAQFASTGHVSRYEAHVVASGLLAVAAALIGDGSTWHGPSTTGRRLTVSVLGLLVLFPLLYRGGSCFLKAARATSNIYAQQYQMGLFVRQYYNGTAVAANDIGALNYLADIRCLDIIGLGSGDVARARTEGTYTIGRLAEIASAMDVRVAIVYDDWLPRDDLDVQTIPPGWVRVAQWTIDNNVVAARDTVSIYALGYEEPATLTAHVRDFSATMPASVHWTESALP